jgi:hypothetical protein
MQQEDIIIPPSCVKCQRWMIRCGKHGGNQRFKCDRCKVHIGHRSEQKQNTSNPHCLRCHKAMSKDNSRQGLKYFRCRPCKIRIHSQPKSNTPEAENIPTPETGEALLEFADSVLPDAIPLSVRDDARQQICVDLLTHAIVAGMLLNRAFVRRRYINPAYGLTSRFRFISTDAPIYADGKTTIGERLVA